MQTHENSHPVTMSNGRLSRLFDLCYIEPGRGTWGNLHYKKNEKKNEKQEAFRERRHLHVFDLDFRLLPLSRSRDLKY